MSNISEKPLVFVTGASGYIGYEIVYQLLQAGYRVRGAARNAKVERLKTAFEPYVSRSQFEAVDVPDVASGDLKQYLEGVDAVIHTAAPLMGRSDVDTAFRTAVDGSLHVLEESYKLGIKRFAVTGSVASWPSSGPFGDDDWNEQTEEEAKSTKDARTIYVVQKKIGEQAVIKFAREHPDTRITIFCPPYVYGPFAPGFEHIVGPEWKEQVAAGNRVISTAGLIYALLDKNSSYLIAAQPVPYVDVRDLARAHIISLQLDAPNSSLEPLAAPRIFILSPYIPKFGEALQLIREKRPELADRLADVNKVTEVKVDHKQDPTEGLKRVEELLGIRKEEFRTYEQTLLDSVGSLIALEKFW
ncbi:hypothetical protein VKT23_012930 [Stygiomarasmius scandens]|uniref:NAD-dependent epimerase/dehydratase domain-containing protein n=1 Tax=Marasmiellus scandens TaxID=2682957 RepID=A0ABR1J4S0_9AGAR